MAIKSTIGQIMVNEALPEEYRDYNRVLIGNELDSLLETIAKDRPELYKDISHKLMQMGRNASYEEGTTIKLSDLMPMNEVRDEIFKHVKAQERKIRNDKVMTPAEKREALTGVYQMAQKAITDNTFKRALEAKNPLAMQVLSKARGNPTQLAAMLSTPGTFTDAKGRTLPIFVQHSYAEGLSPAEYYAATFGARQAVISTKFATRDAGDFGKQLNTAAMGITVTEEDCGTTNGIPTTVDDDDVTGAMLARGANKFDRDTPITQKVLKEMRAGKQSKILVRSPITCQAKNGVCKMCVGLRENGKLPEMGAAIGLQASTPLSERIAQGALNVKHQGGQKSDGGEQTYAGFEIINQLGQVPKNFKHKSTLADLDGTVESIEPAPQGGTNVTVNGQVHYVLPELNVKVKVGDKVEAGDQMSTGIINPAEIVHYKGIGEGRRYFANRLTQAFKESGLTANRRNAEVVARAVIDHVNVEDPGGAGDYLPGDVASYSAMEYSYRPRKDAEVLNPENAVGKYLEQPALHYTIGTRITNKMAQEMKEFGVDKVKAHSQNVGFTPEMVRLRSVAHYGKDWLAKLQGSYLKSNLLKDVQSGSESNIHGTHPVPGLAYGVEFGESKKDEVTY